MVKLYAQSRRDRFYNQGDAYKLLPIYRCPVVPGETFELEGTVKFQTAAFTKNLITGGLASVYFFFVPNRLLWDDWTAFIAQEDGFSGTFPVTATVWESMFDRAAGGGSFSSLYRRAYKLCYNQFFGAEGS